MGWAKKGRPRPCTAKLESGVVHILGGLYAHRPAHHFRRCTEVITPPPYIVRLPRRDDEDLGSPPVFTASRRMVQLCSPPQALADRHLKYLTVAPEDTVSFMHTD